MAENTDETIRVYEIIDAQKIFEEEQLIKSILFEYLKVPKSDINSQKFSIDPISGWLYYLNGAKALSPEAVPFPNPTVAKNVVKSAKEFLIQIVSAYKKNVEYQKKNLPSPFPIQKAKLLSLDPIFKPNSTSVETWICRFQVYVNSGMKSTSNILVLGSTIEIRVTNKGEIFGLSSRWRALTGKTFAPNLKPVPKTHKRNAKFNLFYFLNDESCPQLFLAPFYFSNETLISATEYSLYASMGQIPTQNGIKLVPIILGGTTDLNNYSFSWAAWQPETIFDNDGGLKSLGHDFSLELPLGTYNVLLHIMDSQTKAVFVTQRMIYSKGIIKGCTNPNSVNFNPLANVDDGSCIPKLSTIA